MAPELADSGRMGDGPVGEGRRGGWDCGSAADTIICFTPLGGFGRQSSTPIEINTG